MHIYGDSSQIPIEVTPGVYVFAVGPHKGKKFGEQIKGMPGATFYDDGSIFMKCNKDDMERFMTFWVLANDTQR